MFFTTLVCIHSFKCRNIVSKTKAKNIASVHNNVISKQIIERDEEYIKQGTSFSFLNHLDLQKPHGEGYNILQVQDKEIAKKYSSQHPLACHSCCLDNTSP